MTLRLLPLLFVATAASLAACSEGSSLSTSSILGGGSAAPTPAIAPVVTPTARAFQVGGTAARATKCGYNFDANKLKTNYLAYEAAQAPGTDQSNVSRTYDAAFSGVSKAAATQPEYCSANKTRDIKSALNRHLAGDYTPDPPKPVDPDLDSGGGLFSGFDSGSSSNYKSPSLPTDNSGN